MCPPFFPPSIHPANPPSFSDSDCCNWPQLFCTGAEGEVCGPTVTPPPPPVVPFRFENANGNCLSFNLSGYPCSGGNGPAGGCPLTMGPCSGNASLFTLEAPIGQGRPTVIKSFALQDAGFDVDCSATAPHTLLKMLNSGFSQFVLANGRIEFSGTGMCLNTGQGLPNPPCGPKGELFLKDQIKLTPCNDPSAQGWSWSKQ